MRNLKLFGIAAMFLALVGFSINAAADGKSIKEIMKGQGLKKACDKALGKNATEADKKAFAELCEALSANKCPKGEGDSWKSKTQALVDASKALASGEKGAAKKVQAALNCKACHEAHK